MRGVWRVSWTAALLLAGPGLDAAEISGRLSDPTGGALPGAAVHLLDVATGDERTAQADGDGRYAFAGLEPGIYQLRASLVGFSDAARRVTLTSDDETRREDLELAVGTIHAAVTVTASRGERDELMVPLQVSSLTRSQIELRNPTSTGDSMLGAPGVTPVGNGPFQVRPRLRGLDSSRILILIDGERLNNARVATDRVGVEVGLVDPSSIERVEIVSGSGSVLYGTDALSGTINIITSQPRLSDETHVTGGIDGYYSSNEKGRRGTAHLGVSGPRFAARVVGSLEEFDDYEAGGDFAESNVPLIEDGTLEQADTIDDAFGFDFGAFPDPFNQPFTRASRLVENSGMSGDSLNATAFVQPTENQTLRFKWLRRRADDVGFPDFQPPIFFQSISLPFSDIDKVSGTWERRHVGSPLASLKVSGYWQRQDRLLFNDGIPVQFPVPSPEFFPISVLRLEIDSSTRQQVESLGVDVQARLLLGTNDLLTAGVTWYRDRSEDERTTETQLNLVGTVDLGPRGPEPTVFPFLFPLGPPEVSSPVRVPDATFSDFGVFLQNEWDVSHAVRLSAGVRLDRYSVKTDATPGYDVESLVAGARPPIDPGTLPDVGGETVDRTAFTGDVGFVYQPTDRFSFTGHYGRSYRHPNLEELLFAGPATVGNIIPSIRVDPETGDNFDMGARFRSGRVSASVAAFRNRYHEFISTEVVSEAPAGLLSRAVNFAEVRIQGVEAGLELPFDVGRTQVTVFGNASWLRGDVLEARNPLTGESLDDTPLDNISPFKAVAGVRVSDHRQRFWAEYSSRIQAEVDRVAPTLLGSPFLIAQDLFGLDGFTLHRAAAGFDWRQDGVVVGLSLALENLGDRFYREQFQFAPARGRTFTVGLHVRYE